MRRLRWIMVSAAIVGADQLLKAWVEGSLAVGESWPLLGDILRLTRVHNTGAAFGLFPKGATAFLLLSSLASVAVLGFLLFRRPKGSLALGSSLVLGGALGNLVDRVRLGYIVDFLEFPGFPVFNVADAALVLGAFFLLLGLVRGAR